MNNEEIETKAEPKRSRKIAGGLIHFKINISLPRKEIHQGLREQHRDFESSGNENLCQINRYFENWNQTKIHNATLQFTLTTRLNDYQC